MTELRTVTDLTTGITEDVEYYTHEEFMERKRSKLKELKERAEKLASVNVSGLSNIDQVKHIAAGLSLLAEWRLVRSATGNMVITKESAGD